MQVRLALLDWRAKLNSFQSNAWNGIFEPEVLDALPVLFCLKICFLAYTVRAVWAFFVFVVAVTRSISHQINACHRVALAPSR